MDTHEITREGVTVSKREVFQTDRETKWWIALTIKNRSQASKLVRIVEEFPGGCSPSTVELEATDRNEVDWDGNDSQEELHLTVGIAPDSEFAVQYTPHLPGDSFRFKTLVNTPPRIKNIRRRTDAKTFTPPDDDDSAEDGQARADWDDQTDHPDIIEPPPDVDFSAVAGLPEIKQELRHEIIEPFTDPRYDEYDIGKANGVFLYGPPGSGKTFVSQALAGELGYAFIDVDIAALRSDSFGSNVKNIHKLFEIAEANQPCVVFLDEIDSLAPERDGHLHQARAEAINALLQCVADINDRDADVIVIAATNRPDQVDDALKRTGRFDTRIKIGQPDDVTRIGILLQELDPFGGDVDSLRTDRVFLEEFADATTNFAASDIVEAAESAQRASLRRSAPDEEPHITADLIMEQVETVDDKQEVDTAGEFLTETPDITFADVGGMDDVKARLEETIIEPLEQPELHEEYGLDIANGVLLYGPPGTGKTHLSRAMAGETGCSFLQITASDVVSKWIGEAAQNIGELFDKARDIAPTIVFIDEIDAIANQRDDTLMTTSEEQAVTELLNQISSLDDAEVFVIGATNRPDMIDDALTRSGRLGDRIEIPPPDGPARVEILKTQLSGRPVDEDSIEWDGLEWLTETGPEAAPYTAADLAKIADEAARYAMEDATQEDLQPIKQNHLEKAIATTDPSLKNPDN